MDTTSRVRPGPVLRSAAALWGSRALLMGVCVAANAGCKPQSDTPVGAPASSAGDHPIAPRDAGMPAVASQIATWTCTGSPCPWGASLSNHALAWPAATGAVGARLGYIVSAAVYLPAARANGADIAVATGAARVHAGLPGAVDHRLLATVAAGQTFHVTGLADGEVLSVQADAPFTCRVALPVPGEPQRAGPAAAGEPQRGGSAAPSQPQRNDPAASSEPHRGTAGGPRGRVVHAIQALWRCNHTPGCFSDPWPGSAITWPAWAAHQSNGRSGNVLRFVFSTRGAPLYPYMGAWAQGCEVTAESGTPKVVEWQRGAEAWRQTVLHPGESHVINLVPPEDGALIEGPEGSSTFSVSLRNCTPQRISP